jgi:hypothetical protein
MDELDSQIAALMDDLLEIDIQRAAKQVELTVAMSKKMPEGSRRNLMRAEADGHRRAMERLIGQRRPEAVARLERARGLAHG